MNGKKTHKVLLVSPSPPPVGGIAAWTVHLLAYAPAHSEVELIQVNSAIKFRSITRLGFSRRLWTGIGETVSLAYRFVRAVKRERPQVIHHTTSASFGLFKDWLLLKIAHGYSVPVVIHFHFGRIPDLMAKKNWEWRWLSRVIKNAAMAMVLDRKSLMALQDSGFQNVCIVPNPISPQLEALAQKPQGESVRAASHVLFVGHLIPSKGIKELVAACSRLPSVTELRLVGPVEKEFRHELLALAETRAGNWLVFAGTLNAEGVLEEMRQATLLALPSYTEGFPLTVVEAMAAGCPVVATPVGAIPEILAFDDQTPAGASVPVQDVEALAKAIRSLLDNPQQRLSLAKRAREKVVSDYGMTVVFNQYLAAWQKVLHGP